MKELEDTDAIAEQAEREIDVWQREAGQLRAELVDANARAEKAEAEVEAWKDASGLISVRITSSDVNEPDDRPPVVQFTTSRGDPDGVTPAKAQQHWEGVEVRAKQTEARVDALQNMKRNAMDNLVEAEREARSAQARADEAEARIVRLAKALRGLVFAAESYDIPSAKEMRNARAALADAPAPGADEVEAEPPEQPPWSGACDGCEHMGDAEHCEEFCVRPPKPKPPRQRGQHDRAEEAD